VTDLFTIDPPRNEPAEDDAAPESGGRKLRWSAEAVRIAVGFILIAAVFALLILRPMLSGDIKSWTPSVGDCVTAAYSDADVSSMKALDCADKRAASVVVGVFQDRDEADLDSAGDPCATYPRAESEVFYGKPHNGFILCLAPNTR
jgi:hypothetical protein